MEPPLVQCGLLGRADAVWRSGSVGLRLEPVVFTGAWTWNASTLGESADIGADLLVIVGAGVAVVGLVIVLTTRTRGRTTNR